MRIEIDAFDIGSVEVGIAELARLEADLKQKGMEICARLAEIGSFRASIGFSRTFYVGPNDVRITVEPIENGYAILADGETVLFLEYGAGEKYGYGHPQPDGYGPGTWPGKGHWNDPKGWYLPKAKAGSRAVKSYGNPPAQAMYDAEQDVLSQIQEVALEVLTSD